ncbi:GNAT family N-acetyltransferase [Yinghuangia soli]|uniref:GNAT family N-acetyltransferase n=1 Tax=Yinghuangia soli TaxID=2908204 RepID=A0AA41PWW0_9ACTN|nr:GNAT family protein [Yinghuangia soli]MCF2526329.1 GNAT family N-acetyltransferase [Yinghuangia soli]
MTATENSRMANGSAPSAPPEGGILGPDAFLAAAAEFLGDDALADPAARVDGLDSLERLELLEWIAGLGAPLDTDEALGAATIGQVYALYARAAEAARDRRPAAQHGPGPGGGLLRGRYFQLEPVSPEVMPYLYQLAISSEVGYRWRFRGSVPDYPTFEATFWQGSLAQFVAVDLESEMPAGHVVCYNPDHGQGYAYLGAVFAPGHTGSGRPVDAVRTFARYVFTTWSFRKLYMEVPGFNYPQIRSGAKDWFAVEGQLRDHDYYDGRYWDHYTLAVYRDHIGLPEIAAPRRADRGAPA